MYFQFPLLGKPKKKKCKKYKNNFIFKNKIQQYKQTGTYFSSLLIEWNICMNGIHYACQYFSPR